MPDIRLDVLRMNKAQPLTRNIAKSCEVLNWGGFNPFQLHFGLIGIAHNPLHAILPSLCPMQTSN